MCTHADYVAAVARLHTLQYAPVATHRPVVALRTHLQPRLHDLTSTSRNENYLLNEELTGSRKCVFMSLRGTELSMVFIEKSMNQTCTSGAVAICWKAPLRQWRFREIPTSHDLTSTTMVAYNIKFTSVAVLYVIVAPRNDIIRKYQHTIFH